MDGHPRKDVFESLTHNSFPVSSGNALFAFTYREQYGTNGWAVYDQTQELRRLGLPNERWKISQVRNT